MWTEDTRCTVPSNCTVPSVCILGVHIVQYIKGPNNSTDHIMYTPQETLPTVMGAVIRKGKNENYIIFENKIVHSLSIDSKQITTTHIQCVMATE